MNSPNANHSELLPPSTISISNTDLVELNSLIEKAKTLMARGRDYRLEMGSHLLKIHSIKAKPGYGSFMKTVTEEIGMPYTTARDYMREAQAESHYGTRNNESVTLLELPSAPVEEYDSNDGQADEVEQAIKAHGLKLLEATKAENDPDRPRDFNWKFQQLPHGLAQELKAAKRLLTNHQAASLLITAAKEVTNVESAA